MAAATRGAAGSSPYKRKMRVSSALNAQNALGQDANGNQLADGTYKLAVTATDSSGTAVTSSVASAGTVTQIDMTSGTPQLVIGNMEVGPADIAAVAN